MAIDRQQSGGAEAFFGGAALGLLGQAAGQDYLTPYLDQLKEQRQTRSRFLGQQALLTASIARGEAASNFLTESFPGMEMEDIVEEVAGLDKASFNMFHNGLTQHVNTAGEVENAAAMIIPGLSALQDDGYVIPDWWDINNLTEAMVSSMRGDIASWENRATKDISTMGTLIDTGEAVFSGLMADPMGTDPEVVMQRVNQMNEQGGNIVNDDLRALYHQGIAAGLSKWEAARQTAENVRLNDLINRLDFSGPGWEGGPSINDLLEKGDPAAQARLANAGFDDFTQKMSDRHSEIESLHDLGIDMAPGWEALISTDFDPSNTSNLLKLAQITNEEVKTVVRIHDNNQKRTAFTGAAAAATEQYGTAFDDSDFVQAIDGEMSLTAEAQGEFSFRVMHEESRNFKGDFEALEQRLGTLIGQGLLSKSNALVVREKVKTNHITRLLGQPITSLTDTPDWEAADLLGRAPSTAEEVLANVGITSSWRTHAGVFDAVEAALQSRDRGVFLDEMAMHSITPWQGELPGVFGSKQFEEFNRELDSAISERNLKWPLVKAVHGSLFPVVTEELLSGTIGVVSAQLAQLVALGSNDPAVLNKIRELSRKEHQLNILIGSAAAGQSEFLPYQLVLAGALNGTATEALGGLSGLPKDIAGKRDVAWAAQMDVVIDTAEKGEHFMATYSGVLALLEVNKATIAKQKGGTDKESLQREKVRIEELQRNMKATYLEIKGYLKKEFGGEIPSQEKLEAVLGVDVNDKYELTGTTKGRYSEIKTNEELAAFVLLLTAGEVSFEE